MLKFNLEKSLTNVKFNHSLVCNQFQLGSSINLLGGCLDVVDRQGLGGCSGVGDCSEISWCCVFSEIEAGTWRHRKRWFLIRTLPLGVLM